jgi:hypothetical protein
MVNWLWAPGSRLLQQVLDVTKLQQAWDATKLAGAIINKRRDERAIVVAEYNKKVAKFR